MTHSLTIMKDYSARSHILCGIALKETYADYRIKVLRESEWATWHPKLKVPDGKGWCIKKENLSDLEESLRKYQIPYSIVDCPPREKKDPESHKKRKQKQPPTAYNLFYMNVCSTDQTVGSLGGNIGSISKYIALKWKNLDQQSKEEWKQKASRLVPPSVAVPPSGAVPPSVAVPSQPKTLNSERVDGEPYSKSWDRWLSSDPHRHFEIEDFGDAYRYIVYDTSVGVTATLTLRPAKDEDVFKLAWEKYFEEK